jgi:hypothetical protein
MKFGSIQITKKRKARDCDHCEKPLRLGEFHATVTIRAKAKKSGKHWFANWHLHMKCLSIWLLVQLMARQDRRKAAGRPQGSGMGLSPEDKKKRLALCKRRMRTLQEVATCAPKDKRLEEHWVNYEAVARALELVGGPASINHRTTLDVEATEKKLLYGRSLHGQVTAG